MDGVSPGDDSDSRDDATGQRRRVVASEQEKKWQQDANDYVQRFCGHCNTTTDIKEANFFGRSVLSLFNISRTRCCGTDETGCFLSVLKHHLD